MDEPSSHSSHVQAKTTLIRNILIGSVSQSDEMKPLYMGHWVKIVNSGVDPGITYLNLFFEIGSFNRNTHMTDY